MKATFKLKLLSNRSWGSPSERVWTGRRGSQVKKFEQVWGGQSWGWGSQVNKCGPWGSHVTYHMGLPQCEQTDRQTPMKTLPSHKLRMRAVKTVCGCPGEMVLTRGFVTDGIHCRPGWFSVPNTRSFIPILFMISLTHFTDVHFTYLTDIPVIHRHPVMTVLLNQTDRRTWCCNV